MVGRTKFGDAMPANGNAPREDHDEGGDLDRDEVERLLMEVQSISPYFRGFKDNIDLLAESLTVDRFEGGETILQEGEEGTWMGILLTGELEVVVNGGVVHQMLPGEIVGEMILWFGGVRQATVRARQPGSVATILVSDLQQLSLQRPQVRTLKPRTAPRFVHWSPPAMPRLPCN